MTLPRLRRKHPQFIYKSYDIDQSDSVLTIRYHFLLSPTIVFTPELRIPIESPIDIQTIKPLVFHLGMVEAISYWKAACPPEFIVEAGYLSGDQIDWWKDLMIHGLGEFFYKNKIDFMKKGFLTITNKSYRSNVSNKTYNKSYKGDLILVGGGKDSAVTLEQRKYNNPYVLLVNPTKAARDVVRVSGIQNPIIVSRSISPELFRLNNEGYLNGHTPFSALLAFLGVLVAEIYSIKNVIVSNEKSANEGNVMYRGMEINHQYSKSLAFEEKFRAYNMPFPYYFSYLRQYNDVQISNMFAEIPQYFPVFKSCNVGSRENRWCGSCPKCAFTYLVLFPYVPYAQMIRIFGSDYFQNPKILHYIRELVGLVPVKPFECVGTRMESREAVRLSIKKYKKEQKQVPLGLLDIWKKL